jgi:AraC family transcriptional regulator of adaptative response / DNA-3-methyladenine glycosylase II
MHLDPASCWRALSTHDPRFDGRFFVGVASTGIYCRPVCRVRMPRRENCRYFASAAAAEVAGYRPCLRCRPELAPGYAGIDAGSRLAEAAARLIEDGFLARFTVEDLAARVGISSRHLRRLFELAFGVTPVEFAQTQRLLLAKRLLTDTALPVTDVALASGFSSVRRFNALWRERYRMAPARLRRTLAARAASEPALRFELAYRPPLAFDDLLRFLQRRAIAGVERVERDRYARALAVTRDGVEHAGLVEVSHVPGKPALSVRVAPTLAKVLPAVLARVRHVFDLACDPVQVAEALGAFAQDRPGLRVPGAFDGFEVACRAIAGQQVSVAAAHTLLARMAARFGRRLDSAPDDCNRLFPSAATVAALSAAELAEVGLPLARARTIVTVAREIAEGRLDLSPGADVDPTVKALLELPGIGPWTAQYIAMRGLAWPDAFPHPDLGVMRALGETRPARALAQSEAWRPWRAYAVIHIWSQG